MFENYKVFRTMLAGRELVVETGKVAGLANGSCMIHYGETTILACATASSPETASIFCRFLLTMRSVCIPLAAFPAVI